MNEQIQKLEEIKQITDHIIVKATELKSDLRKAQVVPGYTRSWHRRYGLACRLVDVIMMIRGNDFSSDTKDVPVILEQVAQMWKKEVLFED